METNRVIKVINIITPPNVRQQRAELNSGVHVELAAELEAAKRLYKVIGDQTPEYLKAAKAVNPKLITAGFSDLMIVEPAPVKKDIQPQSIDTKIENIKVTTTQGNKRVTIEVVGSTSWSKEDQSRVYFDLKSTGGCEPISKIYQVLSGTTRDPIINVGDKTFGYQLGYCDSNTKRRSAIEAVESLIAQLKVE